MSSPKPNDKELERQPTPNETSTVVFHPSDGVEGQRFAFRGPNDPEKRWFSCAVTLLFNIVQHSWSGRVTDHLPGPRPGSHSITHQFDCIAGDPSFKDRVDVAIYSSAEQSRHRLTWDVLAKALLVFGTRVAELQEGWEGTEQVFVGDVPTATIAIILVDCGGVPTANTAIVA